MILVVHALYWKLIENKFNSMVLKLSFETQSDKVTQIITTYTIIFTNYRELEYIITSDNTIKINFNHSVDAMIHNDGKDYYFEVLDPLDLLTTAHVIINHSELAIVSTCDQEDTEE